MVGEPPAQSLLRRRPAPGPDLTIPFGHHLVDNWAGPPNADLLTDFADVARNPAARRAGDEFNR